MIIIGELLNSTRDVIKKKIAEKDAPFIRDLTKKQLNNGADYIDLNAGEFSQDETKYLMWMVETIKSYFNCPLSIDSSSSQAIMAVLDEFEGQYIINSISAEKEKFQELIVPLKKYNCQVVALCMDDRGIPQSAEEKLDIAQKLTEKLTAEGISQENIFLDPLVQPVSVQPNSALEVLKTIKLIRQWNPKVNIICGLSNISYGLPKRRLLNRAFLVMCREQGLNSVIADPLDKSLMSLLKASEVLLNNDSMGMEYITASRNNELEV